MPPSTHADNAHCTAGRSPHAGSRRRRAALALAGLAVLLALAWPLVVWQLRQHIVAALGPRASVDAVDLAWDGVRLTGLRIAAAPKSGWPAADELRAGRVLLTPDLAAALRGHLGIARIRVEDGYVSLLRTRQGRLRLLPALLEDAAADGAPQPAGDGPALRIGQVHLVRTEVAFFDASVRRPPLPVRLTGIEARLGPLWLPALDEPTAIELEAVVKGTQRDGHLHIAGSATGATRDAALKVRLRGVDLVALQPYLGDPAQGGVRRGTLDLDLAPTVQGQRLHAPGRVVISRLQLGSGGLAGLPRQALLAFASKNERIELDFMLEGRLDDPDFSLNENLTGRIASALGDKIGLSARGVVGGVGSVIKGLFGQ